MSAAESEKKEEHPLFTEHEQRATLLGYDHDSKMPVVVTLVWLCALVGLGVYFVTLYIPDVRLWSGP